MGIVAGAHLHRFSFSRIPQCHIPEQSIEGEMWGEMSSSIIQTGHSLEGIAHNPQTQITMLTLHVTF